MVSCIEPLKFTTLDGAEREFRLTAYEEAKIARKYSKELTLAVRGDLGEYLSTMAGQLFICLVNKEGIDEDGLARILPPDQELLSGFFNALKEHFRGTPEIQQANERYRPTKGTTQPVNGSISAPSGAPTSVTSESSGSSDSEKSVQ